ncbi:MAG: DUF3299 domain-containing protein [Tepidisphaeraceae bacterium]
MDTAVQLPLAQRINIRMVLFALVLLALVGIPTYIYLDIALTGGIRDAGNGYKMVDLYSMVTFPFDQKYGTIDDVPPKYRALDGQKVILTGEMVPMESAAPEIQSFSLVYSIAKCCYNTEPQVQHFIHSNVTAGQKVPYYGGLVNVHGTLHVKVKKSPDAPKVESVWQFEVEKVEPLG